jgi:hypothetical protein
MTQMRISWQVPSAVRRPYVRVGLTPWSLSRRIEADLRDLHTPGVEGQRAALDQYYLHAALDGLRPGTTYYYGVGHEGFDPADKKHHGTVARFRTAPAYPEKFVFTAFGDQGVTPDALANDKALLGRGPAFHLHAGDICYADGTGHGEKSDIYDPAAWDLFLKQTETVAGSVPWMVTTGNHDMEAWYSPNGYGGQSARWALPDNGFDARRAPGVYSFVYGNVGIVALDANDVSYEIPANLGYSDGRQTAWLDRRLGELRKRTDFVVVFFHHCAYSTSTHASDGGVRDTWVPLFAKHQVDLVINGHNHVYERTDAIRGGAVGRRVPVGASTDPTRDGIVYVTAGGAGKSLYAFPDGLKDSHEKKVRDRRVVAGALHRLLVPLRGGGGRCESPAHRVRTDAGRRADRPLRGAARKVTGTGAVHRAVRRGAWASRHRRPGAGGRGGGLSGPWPRRCPGGRGRAGVPRRRSCGRNRWYGKRDGLGGRSSRP